MLGSSTSIRWAVGKLLQGLEAENGVREAVREDSPGKNSTQNTAEGRNANQDSITTLRDRDRGQLRIQVKADPENTEGKRWDDGEGKGVSIYRGHTTCYSNT